MTAEKNTEVPLVLQPKDLKLIRFCREVIYGRLEVIIENGVPVRIEWMRPSIKL